MAARSAVLAIRVAISACLLFAAYECLVFARAALLYQRDTATSIPAAAALLPFNGSYISRLAAWQAERKEELLSRAVALNPFDAESLIQLGLNAELQNRDAQAAERYYLRAAEVDKMFAPRWTLTNFYFRQQRPAEFFRWARQTLEITPYPAEPVFAQMWLMSSDPAKLLAIIPDRPGILLQYALYLWKEKQLDVIAPVIQHLTAAVKPQDAHAYGRDDLIGPLEDRALLAGHTFVALQMWNTLCAAHWLPYASPSAAQPLSNGDFRNRFFGHGFDWAAVTNVNGISVDQDARKGAVRIAFTGDEPERVAILRQFIPLQPGRNYQLHWRAEADSVSPPTGLHWYIYPVQKHEPQNVESDDLLSSSSPHWGFRAVADSAMLTLGYARPPGSTRATGEVTLRFVSLKETGDPHEKK